MSSNVIQFPLSLDVLIRQLEIADRESRRLKEQVDQLKAELENLQGELIEALNGGTELSTTEEAELQKFLRDFEGR